MILVLQMAVITPTQSAIQKHQFLSYEIGSSSSTQAKTCETSIQTEIVSLWLKSGLSVSFNTQGRITATQFIENQATAIKQYSMLQRGSANCHMPSSSYTGWIFIALVIEQHQSLSDTCSVTRVITTTHLEPCAGSPPSLESIVTFSSGTYDAVAKEAKISVNSNNLPGGHSKFSMFTLTSSFNSANIDEDFMELLLLKSLETKNKQGPNTFYLPNLDKMRRAYYIKRNMILTAKAYIEKNIVDSLRGFHLNPDPADPFGSYMDCITLCSNNDMTKSITFQFYISKARLMTANDVYLIKVKNEKLKQNDPAYTFKEFEYDIKVQREVANNLFKLTLTRYVSSVANAQIVLSFPYTGSDDNWIHFGASIGYGVLYFTNETNGKFKRTEGLHAWYSGTAYHQEMSLLEDDTTNSLYQGANWGDKSLTLLIASLQAFSDAGMTVSKTTNNFGLKLWEANTVPGSFLPYKITTQTTPDGRCFLQGLPSKYCQFYAFLSNANDQNLSTQGGQSIIGKFPNCPGGSKCRYCIGARFCAFTFPGFNEDLYGDPGVRSVDYYDDRAHFDSNKPLSGQVSQFVKFTNNLGRVYYVRCPVHCKTCDQNLECVECFGASTLTSLANGYEYNKCSCPINRCRTCEGDSKCRVCQYQYVAFPSSGDPNVEDCTKSSCPNEYGYGDAFKGRCASCPYQGCKSCDLWLEDAGCTECMTAGFLAIDYSVSDFLAPGDPNYD